MSRNECSYENYKIYKILQGSNKNRENCENHRILQKSSAIFAKRQLKNVKFVKFVIFSRE